jgi:hypothetical protein
MTVVITFLSVALTVWAIPYLVTFFDKRAARRKKTKKYIVTFYKQSELERCESIQKLSINLLEKQVDYNNNYNNNYNSN